MTLLAGLEASDIVGATENESARLKLPDANSGLDGGGFRFAISSGNTTLTDFPNSEQYLQPNQPKERPNSRELLIGLNVQEVCWRGYV